MEATVQHFPIVLLIMLYRVVLIQFESVNEILQVAFKWRLFRSNFLCCRQSCGLRTKLSSVAIQKKVAAQYYFPVVPLIIYGVYKVVVLTLSLWMKSSAVTIRMKVA